MKFSVGDKVQCIGVLHNEIYATNGLVGAVGEVVRGNRFGSTVPLMQLRQKIMEPTYGVSTAWKILDMLQMTS